VVLDNKPTPVAPVTSQNDDKLPLFLPHHR
jgi:hypothetical protein